MGVVYSKNQCLFFAFRIDIPCNLFQNRLIEFRCDHLFVEVVNVKVQDLVLNLQIRKNLLSYRVEDRDLVPFLIVNALQFQLRLQNVGRIMVHEITFDDRFPVGVFKDRLTEDLRRLQGRRRRQADLYGIKIIQRIAVLGLKVFLVRKHRLFIRHIPVKDIAPVGFIGDDQVVIGNGGHRLIITIEKALDQTLHRGNLQFRLLIERSVIKSLYVIELVQGQQVLNLPVIEGIPGLLAQRIPIYQK